MVRLSVDRDRVVQAAWGGPATRPELVAVNGMRELLQELFDLGFGLGFEFGKADRK